MGFFDRMKSVWKGKVANSLNGMEQANPEAVYESAITERERSYKELKRATAGLVALRQKAEEELEKARRDLAQVTPAVEMAVADGDDDTALVLLQQKETLERRVPELEAEIEQLQTRSDDAKQGLNAFKAEIDKLRREKDEMLAMKASAEARIQMQETLQGVSQDADIQGLANERAHIDQMHSDANEGLLDADGVSLRHKVEKARERMAETSAKQQLEAMKAQMRARKDGGSAPARTLDPPSPAASDDTPGAGDGEDAPTEPAPAPDLPKRSL